MMEYSIWNTINGIDVLLFALLLIANWIRADWKMKYNKLGTTDNFEKWKRGELSPNELNNQTDLNSLSKKETDGDK